MSERTYTVTAGALVRAMQMGVRDATHTGGGTTSNNERVRAEQLLELAELLEARRAQAQQPVPACCA